MERNVIQWIWTTPTGKQFRTMEQQLTEMARSDVLRRFDDARDIRIRTEYRDETYKHVMMPVYTTAYTYKGKQYHVLINGQSGRVEGDYPKSPARIAAIAAAVLVIVALVYWFSEGGSGRRHADLGGVWTAAWTAESETELEMRRRFMGLFGGQFANVVEWQEFRDDMLFWKWSNKEIKKGSRLIIRPGQDANFSL